MLEIKVCAFDDRFYLDEEEAVETFPLTFLQGQYGNDISYLYQRAEEYQKIPMRSVAEMEFLFTGGEFRIQ